LKSRRYNRKFSTEQINYEARFDTERLRGIEHIRDAIKILFEKLIEKSTENLSSNDLIRYCLFSNKLDKPISTKLMGVHEVTVETILSKIMKVLQSKDEIFLDESLQIEVVTLRRPIGGARHRRHINIAVDRLKKRSILSVNADDDFNVCCAKAIILAKGVLENDPDLKTLMKKDSSILLRRALALHSAARVPEGPCGFDEIKQFESFLDLQIAVVSAENLLKVCIFY